MAFSSQSYCYWIRSLKESCRGSQLPCRRCAHLTFIIHVHIGVIVDNLSAVWRLVCFRMAACWVAAIGKLRPLRTIVFRRHSPLSSLQFSVWHSRFEIHFHTFDYFLLNNSIHSDDIFRLLQIVYLSFIYFCHQNLLYSNEIQSYYSYVPDSV